MMAAAAYFIVVSSKNRKEGDRLFRARVPMSSVLLNETPNDRAGYMTN